VRSVLAAFVPAAARERPRVAPGFERGGSPEVRVPADFLDKIRG